MEKKLLISFIILCSCFTIKAQDSSHKYSYKPNAIKINLLSPVFSTVNLSFEHRMKPDFCWQLGAAYMSHESGSDDDGHTNAVLITPEVRYILDQHATGNGYSYIGAFTRYIWMQYQQSDRFYPPGGPSTLNKVSTSEYHSLGIGIILGQKIIFRDRVCFDLFAGPLYSGIIDSKSNFYNKSKDDLVVDGDLPHSMLRRYSIRAGFTVGFMF